LPFSFTFFPGLLYYSAFWYPAVCYIVVLSCLLRKSICSFKLYDRCSNNQVEQLAIVKALEVLEKQQDKNNEPERAVIYTDSKITLDSIISALKLIMIQLFHGLLILFFSKFFFCYCSMFVSYSRLLLYVNLCVQSKTIFSNFIYTTNERVTVTEWVTLQLPQLALTSHLFYHGYRTVGKGYALCKVRSEIWEISLILVTGCVFSDIRSEAEEIVEHWVWLWAARPRDRDLISDKRIRFFCPLLRQDWLWNITNFLCCWVKGGIFLEVNLPGRERGHSLPSSVKVKK
jgi:hypothetical protein